MRYPHTRPRPRSLRTPSTRAYAFDTHAYALDTPHLDTTRMRSTPSRTPSMPPPLTPRVRVQHPRVHLSMPRPQHPRVRVQHPRARVQHPRARVQHPCAHSLTCTGQMPCILGPRHMQACEQVQGAWKRRRWCRHVCRGSVACGGFAAHGGVQKECQQGTGAARCADAPWRL
ncbi:hypothetical protein BJV77DRAFT_1040044 [Russula vinacea]|nr:hypothetical protein BJV77DRAFT_1040044 [Russula vinacea]